ncbi:MAG: MFS transporter, partial [Oscillospiraceae bacterium]
MEEQKKSERRRRLLPPAMAFILLMGIVSLFSDMTHEGARSIMGSYLSMAGASAAAIGFVSGLGECIGYSFRLITGIIADKTKRYWPMTILGYIIDVVAIPALALVPRGGWKLACLLIIIERAGKAIKKPAKDTLLSFAASQAGAGKSFAIQEFLDQIGAFLGPVILFLVLFFRRGGDTYSTYSFCFAILGIPALVTIALLFFAKRKYPNPENFEPEPAKEEHFRMKPSFVLYIVAISLFAMGFLDFPLITMHVARTGLLSEDVLPLLYAGAMVVDAFSALLFGWLYDRFGIRILMLSTALSAFFAVFIFGFHDRWSLFLGIALWGIGMGAQESILKAAISSIMPKQSRSTGFGIFETAFGIFWFLGSWFTGVLYDLSLPAMIAASVLPQLLSIPIFYLVSRRQKTE